MTVMVAQYVVLCFGVLIAVLSLLGIARVAVLMSMVSDAMDQSWGIYVAELARLVLGLALIFAAPASLYPTTFQVLGWITLAAAVGLAIMGRVRVRALIARVRKLPDTMLRIWLLFGFAFGAFMGYAAVCA